jgi:hypothetical protein
MTLLHFSLLKQDEASPVACSVWSQNPYNELVDRDKTLAVSAFFKANPAAFLK